MGLRDLFSKKASDKLNKYFQELNISLNTNDGMYSFEIYLNEAGYALYPYFTFNDDNALSFIVNVRRITNDENVLNSINEFNLKSKYLVAKSNLNSIYLEYNTICYVDNIKEVIKSILDNIYSLQIEIDKL